MAVYVPDDRDALDRLVAQLVELYATAERRLQASLAAQMRAGLEVDPVHPERALRLGELQTEAQRVARWLAASTPEVLDRILATAAERGTEAALHELAEAHGYTITPGQSPARPAPTVALTGAGAAATIRADLSNALEDVTRRVLRYPDDVYRRVIGATATEVVLGTGTTRTAQQAAWNRLLDQGVTGFTDRAGRRWQLTSYVEMATRAATRRAFDDAKVGSLQEAGVDLVSVVVGYDSCERCARWSGRILRTTPGPTGRVTLERADGDGEVTVRIDGTLDEAKAAGWRHPNCTCTTVAYLPGLSVVQDATTHDPEAEANRARLRYLEREVRKAKSEAGFALDDDDRRHANARVRELQARIRELVDETGLIRQRHREQPNLGHVRR